ncbi:glycosyltransferase [Derxia gummosa]|uniref:Glycosyltransferase n=1 Tax=Derxia gummosa DSM 723 TaxID=1121388 RepID=A0A8B6XCB4_9BURK|nr:glycosyltransferase [Derxia gummosa]
MSLAAGLHVAVVHDWLVTFGGAERVLHEILLTFPQADLFAVVEDLPAAQRGLFPARIATSFIQRLPGARRHYWYYAPLMPLAIEQLDLGGYDLVISCSHAVARGVLVGPDQVHVSYVHSPMRFVWDLQADYLRNFGWTRGPKRWLASLLFHYLRGWDQRATPSVDLHLAASHFIARRIRQCWGVDATVLSPPIDIDRFRPDPAVARRDGHYLAGAIHNPFKRLDLLVRAFNRMPERRLTVFGAGPQGETLRRLAGPNIDFTGFLQPAEVHAEFLRAPAYLSAGTEDFGMAMVEAQACGTPVIAYARGGASEIVRPLDDPHGQPTGVLFDALTEDAVIEAVRRFETGRTRIRAADCRANAMRFAAAGFRARLAALVDDTLAAHRRERAASRADARPLAPEDGA